MTGPAGNLATLVRDAARTVPQKSAIVTSAGSTSWKQLSDRVAQKAAILSATGVQPGDRIALHAGMSPFAVEALAAISWAGLVVVPLNHRLSPPEQRQICARAEVSVLVFEGEVPPEGLSVPGIRSISAKELAVGAPPIGLVPSGNDALAALVFTGGTTGVPKGVMLRNADLALHGETVRRWLRYDANDRVLQSQPLFHVAGINQLYAVAMARAALVFADTPGMDGMIAAIEDLGAGAIGLVPTMLSQLLDRMESAGTQLPHLHNIVYGAAPITPELMARARRLLPVVRFAQFYGQTETGPTTALLPEDHDSADPQRLRSCGRPRPGLEMRIVAPSGRACSVGEVGEVRFRGSGLTQGYWHDEAQTAALYADGWLCSGDLGFVDQDGYLTIVDRMKDMIVSGGENIYSAEVEAILAAHPAVKDVAVLGVPDSRWGEAVHAVVVPAEDTAAPAEDELIEFCRGKIAGYKIPRHVHLRRDALPLSAVGKVLKTALRKEILNNDCS